MESLQGKTAIVTGGGSGIGRGITLSMAALGVNLVICGRRADSLDETIRLAGVTGSQIQAVRADVSKPGDVSRVVEVALAKFDRIDILINNAAIFAGAPVHEMNIALWDQIMATNLRGPFLMCRAVLPLLRAQRSGHIINISSESGLEYYENDAAYGISKHALNALGEYIQRENQAYNIRVNTICPGMVVSEMTENEPGLDHSKCLYPDDLAELVIWLLTRRANIKIGTPVLIQTMLNPWG
jgi:meso-butanediol dehydrogenase/(S,S)-butanediol dehydrogenase/diacetyl reductase